MASPRLVVDGNTSRAAIMINADPGDTAANIADPSFADPLANFGDWKWAGHPDVDYLGIVSAKTGSVPFYVNAGGWVLQETPPPDVAPYKYRRTLFAHGLSYTPIVIGYLTVDGHNLPLAGDSYFNIPSGSDQGYHVFNVYADATNVYLYTEINGGNFRPSSGPVYNYTVYVCNMGLDGSGNLVRPPLNSGFEASGSRLRCGRFDTNYGYFYKDTSGAVPIYRGRSLSIDIGRYPSSSTTHALGYVFNVNGYNLTSKRTLSTTDDIGWNWPGTDSSAASLQKMSAAMPAASPAFDAGSGRITFGNVLDTDRNMFLISNALLNKTVTIPSRTVTSLTSYLNETLTYDLGSVHPNATDVLGLVTFDGQTRSLGGTNVVYFQNLPMRGSRYQEQSGNVSQLAATLFFYISISGGKLVLTAKRKVPRLTNTRTYRGTTIKVNALVGAFDY